MPALVETQLSPPSVLFKSSFAIRAAGCINSRSVSRVDDERTDTRREQSGLEASSTVSAPGNAKQR